MARTDSDAKPTGQGLAEADLQLPGVLEHPDDPRLLEQPLPPLDERILDAVEARLLGGAFALPQLPGNSLALVRMACDVESDVEVIVGRLERDPALASAVLGLANSVQHAGQAAIDTLQGAVIRIGLNTLRSLVVTCALRSAIFSGGRLPTFARQVWRGAYAAGCIAREIHRALDLPIEVGFVRGLLHDLGKISLLVSLNDVQPKNHELSRRTVARCFHRWHESAGAELARAWCLPNDLIILASQHEAPDPDTQSARVVRLAHRLDRLLCLGWVERYRDLAEDASEAPELEALGLFGQRRETLLLQAVGAFRRATAEFADR